MADEILAPAETPAPAAGEVLTEAQEDALFAELSAKRSAADDTSQPVEETEEPEEPKAAPVAAVEEPKPAAAAPAAAAPDIWANASAELRAAHEAEVAKWNQKYNSDIGRQAAYQRQIADLQSQLKGKPAATDTPAPTPKSLRENPAVKKTLDEYPEVAGPILDAVEERMKPLADENERLRGDVKTLSDARHVEVVSQQEAALTAAHPDWRAACSSKDFADWLNEQPASIKQIVQRNGEQVVDAQEAIAMVGNFKAHFALTHPRTPQPAPAATAPTNLADRRAKQLEAVKVAPSGGLVGIPDGAPTDDNALFDHFAAKKAGKK